MKGGQQYNNMRDMFDGGGAGQSGTRFEGGPMSDMLNNMGIRPIGYMDSLGQQRPQARPTQPAMMTSRNAPGPMQGPGMPPMQGPQNQPMQGPLQTLNQPGNAVDPQYIARLMEAARNGDQNAADMLRRMASGIL